MTRFLGRFEHSLDSKGRVILPARFRSSFERGGVLSQNREGCLALWTPEEFERQADLMQAASGLNKTERNKARIWAAGAADVEIDRAGRMPIPANLRQFAQLAPPGAAETAAPAGGTPVLVLGALDRVELWNPSVWDEKVAPDVRHLLDDTLD